MALEVGEADDAFIEEQLVPLGGQFTYGFTDQVLYRTWIERSQNLKSKSFDKRIIVVTKYKVLLIKKSVIGKRSLDRAIHLYDITELNAVDSEGPEHFELLYQVIDKNDKKEDLGIHVKCPTGAVATSIIKNIRTAYRKITVGFPEEYQIKIGLPPERVERLDPNFTVHPLSAGGLIDQYISLSYYYNTKPTLDFVRHIEGVCAVNSIDLDLTECPGIDPSSELGFNLFTGITSLRHNTYFRGVRVHGVAHPSVLNAVGTALSTNRTLTRVVLTDLHTEQSFVPIGKALATNAHHAVQYLNLSKNKLSFQALASLCDAISKFPHALLRLDLSYCEIPPKGVEMVFNSFERNFGSSLRLQHLDLSHNKFQDQGSLALAGWLAKIKGCHSLVSLVLETSQLNFSIVGPPLRVANVQLLNLSNNRITDRATARYLGDVVECYTGLTNLDLTNMRIGPEATEEIATMMARNKFLSAGSVTLNLAQNELGQKGAVQLARFLPQSQFLKSLDISNNKIPAKALSEILLALGSTKTLETLNLGRNILNNNDVDVFISNLSEYITQHPNLKTLGLRGAKPGLGVALYPILMLLARNQSLTHLDVSDNNLKDLGASIAGEALRTNSTLLHLDIDRNGFTISGWMALTSPIIFRTNRHLQHLSLPLKPVLYANPSSATAPENSKEKEPENISLNRPQYEQLLDLLVRVDQRLKMNRPTPPSTLHTPSIPTPTTVVPLIDIPEHLSLLAPPPPIARRRTSPNANDSDTATVSSISTSPTNISMGSEESEFSPQSGFSPAQPTNATDWAEDDSWDENNNGGEEDDEEEDEESEEEEELPPAPVKRQSPVTTQPVSSPLTQSVRKLSTSQPTSPVQSPNLNQGQSLKKSNTSVPPPPAPAVNNADDDGLL
eukprot:TRINITY_DN2191_c0_g1_i2.p1 TRINITY_DN2191_c0_g1~~TRINITY_DN2191_c0_g1_i2.p1  ORF type:complete len:897 (-),score=195.19 TRINITY_DN2191_c0_g1_i2:116-2806(-)